jgi:hypothetical protein
MQEIGSGGLGFFNGPPRMRYHFIEGTAVFFLRKTGSLIGPVVRV